MRASGERCEANDADDADDVGASTRTIVHIDLARMWRMDY